MEDDDQPLSQLGPQYVNWGTQLFCRLCRVRGRDEENLKDHVLGKKHRHKLIENIQYETKLNGPPLEPPNDLPQVAAIQKEFEKMPNAVLGLQYLVEHHARGYEPVYFCELCSDDEAPLVDSAMKMMNHIVSPIHRMAYLKKHYPKLMERHENVMATLDMKEWHPHLEFLCYNAEQEEGEREEVKVGCNVEMFKRVPFKKLAIHSRLPGVGRPAADMRDNRQAWAMENDMTLDLVNLRCYMCNVNNCKDKSTLKRHVTRAQHQQGVKLLGRKNRVTNPMAKFATFEAYLESKKPKPGDANVGLSCRQKHDKTRLALYNAKLLANKTGQAGVPIPKKAAAGVLNKKAARAAAFTHGGQNAGRAINQQNRGPQLQMEMAPPVMGPQHGDMNSSMPSLMDINVGGPQQGSVNRNMESNSVPSLMDINVGGNNFGHGGTQHGHQPSGMPPRGAHHPVFRRNVPHDGNDDMLEPWQRPLPPETPEPSENLTPSLREKLGFFEKHLVNGDLEDEDAALAALRVTNLLIIKLNIYQSRHGILEGAKLRTLDGAKKPEMDMYFPSVEEDKFVSDARPGQQPWISEQELPHRKESPVRDMDLRQIGNDRLHPNPSHSQQQEDNPHRRRPFWEADKAEEERSDWGSHSLSMSSQHQQGQGHKRRSPEDRDDGNDGGKFFPRTFNHSSGVGPSEREMHKPPSDGTKKKNINLESVLLMSEVLKQMSKSLKGNEVKDPGMTQDRDERSERTEDRSARYDLKDYKNSRPSPPRPGSSHRSRSPDRDRGHSGSRSRDWDRGHDQGGSRGRDNMPVHESSRHRSPHGSQSQDRERGRDWDPRHDRGGRDPMYSHERGRDSDVQHQSRDSRDYAPRSSKDYRSTRDRAVDRDQGRYKPY